jgi:hypothetical protein
MNSTIIFTQSEDKEKSPTLTHLQSVHIGSLLTASLEGALLHQTSMLSLQMLEVTVQITKQDFS